MYDYSETIMMQNHQVILIVVEFLFIDTAV
jgi:hypothetical protein